METKSFKGKDFKEKCHPMNAYIIDYRSLDKKNLIAKAKSYLKESNLILIDNFPSDVNVLIDFSRNFGKPLLKHTANGKSSMDYVGDVRFRSELSEEKRLPTQGNEEIGFHTARAYTVERPTYFAMLMTNQGWINQFKGFNGESLLVRCQDIIDEFKIRYPLTAENDLKCLMTTKVSYKPWYVKDKPTIEPILFYLSEGDIGFRYWEDIVLTTEQLVDTFDDKTKDIFIEVLGRFHNVVQTCQKIIEYQMVKNQLMIIDNRRVAHGRKAFISTQVDVRGQTYFNPRQIFSIHLF